MKPLIKETGFGYIVIEGTRIEHDVVIRLSGKVRKRRKKLSKAVYGTSHVISLDEAKDIYQKGAKRLVVGAGQQGMLKLSKEAADYLEQKQCQVDLQPTPTAIERWNEAQGAVVGLFHVTC